MRLSSEIENCVRPVRARRACAGFSLAELSVVLAIISVIAVMGLELTANYMNRTAYKVTQERLIAIDKAIAQYTRVHNKLPCPAGAGLTLTNTCYGKELNGNGGAGTCANTLGACAAAVIGGTTLFFGDVPVRDLGLPLSYMVDAYGSRFNYVASGNQVYSRTYHITNNFERTADQIEVRSGKLDSSCGGGGQLCQSRGQASYFVFSVGADKRGSRTPANATPSPSCATGNFGIVDGYIDTANCRFGAGLALVKNGSTLISPAIPHNVFYDSRFNNGTTDAHFDDLVKWRAKGNL